MVDWGFYYKLVDVSDGLVAPGSYDCMICLTKAS